MGLAVVVSEARDGQYLAHFAESFGFQPIRGSSTRGAVEAPGGALRGSKAAPRGLHARRPARAPERVQARSALAAQRAGVPLMPIRAAHRAWRLRSWDRFMIPKPFARVRVVYGTPFTVERGPAGEAAAMARAKPPAWTELVEPRPDGPREPTQPPPDPLALDQPADRCAAGAAGPVAGSAALYRVAMRVRSLVYARGWLQVHDLPLPSVAVGNLTVGGSGKTPIAIWIAQYYAGQGIVPGILLRGYGGGDETLVHRAVGARGPRRGRSGPGGRGGAGPGAGSPGARAGRCLSATRRSARPESAGGELPNRTRAVRWPLPAGPWREGLDALDRADAVDRDPEAGHAGSGRAARRRTCGPAAAARLPSPTSGWRIYEGLVSGRVTAGARACRRRRGGGRQRSPTRRPSWPRPRSTGAAVQVATWKDHHEYRDEDVAWLARAARKCGSRGNDREGRGEAARPLAGQRAGTSGGRLAVTWEAGRDRLAAALDAVVTPSGPCLNLPRAAVPE